MEIEKTLKKEKERIINECISRDLFTLEEYNEKFKERYLDHLDQYGCDSFLSYMSYILCGFDKNGCFATLNKKIIKNRKKLEKRFGLKILTPTELLKKFKNGN